MRGGHCLEVWTKKQQVVSLSSAESELHAAAKAASQGLGIQSVAKDMGIECKLTQHLPQFGQPQETGESETRRCAVPVDRGGFQVREICHKEGRHEREPRRLDD